jgi:hypothetical protein
LVVCGTLPPSASHKFPRTEQNQKRKKNKLKNTLNLSLPPYHVFH